jgi:hypothetical protein
MQGIFAVTGSALLLAAATACVGPAASIAPSSAIAPSPTPTTSAAATAPTTSAAVTVSPGPTATRVTPSATASPGATATFDCSPYTHADAIGRPGFDPVLEALFPASVNGHDVLGSVWSASYMAYSCQVADPQDAADLFPAGWDPATVTKAWATYEFPDYPSLYAMRAPGRQASDLRDRMGTVPGASPANIGGKEVIVVTNGVSLYLYATGEVLFMLSAAHAAAFLGALP